MTSPDDWKLVIWGGTDGNYDDRMWYTRIHDPETRWWRKFPLDRAMDDTCAAYEFVFSSGRTFKVPNSCTMAMDPDGPKYLPEHQGEPDPRKQHPKISEEYGKREKWVKYRRK